MALTTPSASPAVSVREIDLTGVAPNVQTSTGAIAGNFKWGPVGQRVLVSSETQLVATFGTPTEETAVDFLSAAYFLKYSGSLYVVRSDDDGVNASSIAESGTRITNSDEWENVVSTIADEDEFFAKYPGALGNALSVSVCPASGFGLDELGEDKWKWVHPDDSDITLNLSNLFDSAPINDELHVVVIDRTGAISGTEGSVLETFAYLSMTKGSKDSQGGVNYAPSVINKQSAYVWMAELSAPFTDAETKYFDGGVEATTATHSLDLFSDKDTVTVDFLICQQGQSVNAAIAIAESRKDCVVVASPDRDDVVSNGSATTDVVAWVATLTRSSYAVLDCNFFKVYDKYNDKYVYIPAASSTAGLMAATDKVSAPWFSPAGERRGRYLGVTDLAFNPSKADRDTLYKAGVNPIANIPGSGVLLYGDKTFESRPSAFDRINVRRLFLTLERSIEQAGKNVMFEFNDEFTRAEFVNIVEPLLREVQGRRGITEFLVVCDESNNTGAVIDRNEFVASIFIKPARSINYVTLNFVAVRTGVEFEEVVGLV